MGFGAWQHWLIVLIIVVLLFGAGRISGVMSEFGKGIKSFKKGLADDDNPPAGDAGKPAARIGDERSGDPRTTSAQPSADLDKR